MQFCKLDGFNLAYLYVLHVLKTVRRCQNIETSPLKSNTKLKMNIQSKMDKTTENERKSSKKEKERK